MAANSGRLFNLGMSGLVLASGENLIFRPVVDTSVRVLRAWMKVTAVVGSPTLIVRRKFHPSSDTLDVLNTGAVASADLVSQEILNLRRTNFGNLIGGATDADELVVDRVGGTSCTIDLWAYVIEETD